MKLVTILMAVLALSACGNNVNKTREQHIAKSEELCKVNGGLTYIENSDSEVESVNCGYRCMKTTGMIIYTGRAQCNNGASFSFTFKQ
jgi:protein involved in sex pheromone biosynthesis